jgi:hypothetical protein
MELWKEELEKRSNGRIKADMYITCQPTTWQAGLLHHAAELRRRYRSALRRGSPARGRLPTRCSAPTRR